MEFKLNKIDTDIRRKVNEASKEGKVHGADHNLNVNKDKREQSEKNSFYKHEERNEKILINAEKKQNIDIEVFSEGDVLNSQEKGRFLDIRK